MADTKFLHSKEPSGDLAGKWERHKNEINLVSPANKRLIDVIVVGTGLAGGSASATLAELGYNVKSFCFQDSKKSTLYSSSRRHKCSKELPRRWRLYIPVVLRYN